jgi:hypothetical protein
MGRSNRGAGIVRALLVAAAAAGAWVGSAAAAACGSVDGDGDGLSCDAEVFVYGTDVERADTDGDGWSDGLEAAVATDALDGGTDAAAVVRGVVERLLAAPRPFGGPSGPMLR